MKEHIEPASGASAAARTALRSEGTRSTAARPLPQPTLAGVAGVLALQRAAGNAAVVALFGRGPGAVSQRQPPLSSGPAPRADKESRGQDPGSEQVSGVVDRHQHSGIHQLISVQRRPPDVSSNNYFSFSLRGMVPTNQGEVRVQFHQDPANAATATFAVWYQETGTMQSVSFSP